MNDEEKQLLAELRTLPDFECYLLPARWYKADKSLVPPSAENPRTFIESGYTIKCANTPKDLPMIDIREPQQNGKLIEVPAIEPVIADTISRPYTLTETPSVLPSLLEIPVAQ